MLVLGREPLRRSILPSIRRGRLRRSKNVTLPQRDRRSRGRSDTCGVFNLYDLPTPRRVLEVALHLLVRRGCPFLWRGFDLLGDRSPCVIQAETLPIARIGSTFLEFRLECFPWNVAESG